MLRVRLPNDNRVGSEETLQIVMLRDRLTIAMLAVRILYNL